jgi:DNA-binding XRE family transcriptional regulator
LHFLTLRCKRPISPPYPKKIVTTGDHIRKVRLDRGLYQSDVAKIIGVTTDAITNWELNRVKPKVSLYPKIIEFLGYNPMERKLKSLGERVIYYRYSKGIQSKVLAKQIGIDPATLTRIELEKNCLPKSYNLVFDFLSLWTK